MTEFKILTKIIRAGQPRPYADSEYEYEIKTEGLCSKHTVKRFCTNVLKPCHQTKSEWNTDDANSYFGGYYKFSEIGENKYRYYVKIPYTG